MHVPAVLVVVPSPQSSWPLQTPLFSGLPKPKPAPKKLVVQFRVPITYGDAPASTADDEVREFFAFKGTITGWAPARHRSSVLGKLQVAIAAKDKGSRVWESATGTAAWGGSPR